MAKVILTPEQKLMRRIDREFDKKRLIGDISINDEEYRILLGYLAEKLRWLRARRMESIYDRMLSTALVQIGIRKYDKNFWSHVKEELHLSRWDQSDQTVLGKSFIRTLKAHRKYMLNESDRRSANILLHGFVSDFFAPKFFDFLYAFYTIDLERDLSRLNRDTMHDLIEVMQRSDNTGRTYFLVEQTADAVRLHIRGARTRVRRYLKLIDHAVWNEPLPEKSQNRLTRRFLEWASGSEDIKNAQRKGSGTRAKKQFSAPYLKYSQKTEKFRLILPSQLVRFQENMDFSWKIAYPDRTEHYALNPFQQGKQGVTGYKTEERSVQLRDADILQKITITLMNGDAVLRTFQIKESMIRFFDMDGDLVPADRLQTGYLLSVSKADHLPVSSTLQHQDQRNGLCYCIYDMQDGDMIFLEGMQPIAVGNRVTNGLLPRGHVPGVSHITSDGNSLPVYSAAPLLTFSLPEHRVKGTALLLNGEKIPLCRNDNMIPGAMQFPLMDGTDQAGIMLPVTSLGCIKNGVYRLELDIPGRNSRSVYQFLLIHGFRYTFADAPYNFTTNGTLCVPDTFSLSGLPKEHTGNQFEYKVELNAESSTVSAKWGEYILAFEVPLFRYRFAGENWMIAAHQDIWHSDFQTMLEVQAPGSQLIFSIDNSEDDRSETFRKTISDQLFHCDLNRFLSWIDREQPVRTISVQFSENAKKHQFVRIVTKSILFSGLIKADAKNHQIIGEFVIKGKSEYYADLYYKEECIAEKVPLIDGRFTVETKFRTGTYTAKIFEAEEDESGFGCYYYEIGNRNLEVIDPTDLTGKTVLIKKLEPIDNPESYMILFYKYLITNLKKADEPDSYWGKMIVKTDAGTIKATFPVRLTIPDTYDLTTGYVDFDDEGEMVAFIYDSVKRIIIKYEDQRKGKSVRYRRYDPVIYQDAYVYRFEFVIPTEEERSAEVDETGYNNLRYKKI